MGIVTESLPLKCPGCGELMATPTSIDASWNCISIGNEVPAGTNYSVSRGVLGGLLGFGTSMGFSHRTGDLKSTRIDLYQCCYCGKTVQRKSNIYW